VSNVLVIGISLGCVYGFVAVGFSLIYRTTGVLNFSQGAFVMLGGMGAGYAADAWKLPLPLAALVGIGAAVLGGLLLAVGVVLPLWKRGATEFITILSTLLFLVAVENIVLNLFGSEPRRVPHFLSRPPLHLGPVSVDTQTLFIVVAAVVISVGLSLVLRNTRSGAQMRAVATDQEVSRLLGINPHRVALIAFLIAALIGGIGGVLIAPLQFAAWNAASLYNIKGFVAAIVGGLADVRTALLGGLVVGIGEALIGVYVSTTYLDLFLLMLLLVLLLVRPTGLFAKPVALKY
jgi:branched-chain amino acid transport system permease protein